MSLPLRLSDTSSVQTVYNAGISVENMTWWFWIKAGMGFTIGGGIVYVVALLVWTWMVWNAPGLILWRVLTR